MIRIEIVSESSDKEIFQSIQDHAVGLFLPAWKKDGVHYSVKATFIPEGASMLKDLVHEESFKPEREPANPFLDPDQREDLYGR